MAWTRARKPPGPHHDSKPSLVVHSSHTSSPRARYVPPMPPFGLFALTAAPDPPFSFIWFGLYVKFFDVSPAPLAHLRPGRAALPTNCGTGRATCRVPGMAPP